MNTLDVTTIERELTALWNKEGEDNDGVTRASLLNLLVYIPSAEAASEVDGVISEIIVDHPCRAIVIVADREATEPYLNAEVTSRCSLQTDLSKQVCCEQVTLNAGGERMKEAPSAVESLLLSDLPVYLWWRAEPRLGDRVFKNLADASDRIIIDSADFESPHEDLRSLVALVRDSQRWTAFSDLNWARLGAWRGLLASFYDAPQYRPSLDSIDEVLIEYAPSLADKSAIAPRALALAGWFASRLGWKLNKDRTNQNGKVITFEFKAQAQAVRLDFAPISNTAIEPGRIALVTLRNSTNAQATFKVKRSEDRSRIETEVVFGGEHKIRRVLSYENLTEAELIGREIEILGRDRVYEQAIIAAGEMVALLAGAP